jgi:hypothetical protein
MKYQTFDELKKDYPNGVTTIENMEKLDAWNTIAKLSYAGIRTEEDRVAWHAAMKLLRPSLESCLSKKEHDSGAA